MEGFDLFRGENITETLCGFFRVLEEFIPEILVSHGPADDLVHLSL
jgi:hypothetical protein